MVLCVEISCRDGSFGTWSTEETSEIRPSMVFGQRFAGWDDLQLSFLSQQNESLQRAKLTEEIEDGEVAKCR